MRRTCTNAADRYAALCAGLALDAANRRLYYTNIGSMTVDGKQYSWHKVETVRIDAPTVEVRTIVSSFADRPRAIAVDSSGGSVAVAYSSGVGVQGSVGKVQGAPECKSPRAPGKDF